MFARGRRRARASRYTRFVEGSHHATSRGAQRGLSGAQRACTTVNVAFAKRGSSTANRARSRKNNSSTSTSRMDRPSLSRAPRVKGWTPLGGELSHHRLARAREEVSPRRDSPEPSEPTNARPPRDLRRDSPGVGMLPLDALKTEVRGRQSPRPQHQSRMLDGGVGSRQRYVARGDENDLARRQSLDRQINNATESTAAIRLPRGLPLVFSRHWTRAPLSPLRRFGFNGWRA